MTAVLEAETKVSTQPSLTITRDALRLGLESVQGAAMEKGLLPVLSTVKMEAVEGGLVRFAASDLDTSVSYDVRAEVHEEGSICLPAKRLLQIAKAATLAPITIKVADHEAKIRAGRTSYTLRGLAATEFPEAPKMEDAVFCTVRAGDIWRLSDLVSYCVSTEETRPILNGVLWKIEGAAMHMVATNGHRLAVCSIPATLQGAVEGWAQERIVLPRTLQLGRGLFDDDDMVEVSFSGNHMAIEGAQAKLVARLVEGPYPNYQQVIPKDHDKVLIVERDAMVRAVRRVAIISASHPNHRIRVSLAPEGVIITAQTPDEGDALDAVSGEYEGEPLDIGFNARYLLELLQKIPTDRVRMQFAGPERAVTLLPEGDGAPDLLNLLMPLRLND